MTFILKTMLGAAIVIMACIPWAQARAVVDESHCHSANLPSPLRQTIVVVDGQLVLEEPDGPKPENQRWRRFAMQFLDISDPMVRQRIDARERVTIAVANADGSGITPFFIGCVPLFRNNEEADLDGRTTTVERFFGTDWRSQLKKAGERFRNSATLALVQNVSLLPVGGDAQAPAFRDSSLVSAVARSPIVSLENGLPRVILYTDLDRYSFPSGDAAAIRATARTDAERVRMNLAYAEVHVVGVGRNQGDAVNHYLSSFFLGSRGHLATLTSPDGAMTSVPVPRSLAFFQGTIDFPDSMHPVRMRLATDQNGTLVNSWIEMQTSTPKYVPVFGVLTCQQEKDCQYVGDNIFAQIWDDNPDTRPDLQPWQPFGGMRNLHFELKESRISGRIKDELGYIAGREDGLDFTLDRIDGALF